MTSTAELGQHVQRFEAWAAFVDVVVGDDGDLKIDVTDEPNIRTAEDARELAAALTRAAGYVDSQ